jgi:hypothetical protein
MSIESDFKRDCGYIAEELSGNCPNDKVVMLPKPCPFCGSSKIDLSMARGFESGDESKPVIGAGCWKCGAVGPMVQFESATGYKESQAAWDKRAT